MNTLSKEEKYHGILSGNLSLDREDLEALVKEYPYSLPLQYAWNKRTERNSTYTRLYAPHVFWLAGQEALYPKNEKEEEHAVEVLEPSVANYEKEETEGIEIKEGEEVAEAKEGIEVEAEVQQIEAQKAAEGQEIEIRAADTEKNVSKYDDELMPYSFKWWLHKTRLEHADTYRPFASEPLMQKQTEPSFDFEIVDQVFLDQQIRSSILHYQNPEEKISPQYVKPENEVKQTRKTDEILERFIQEEPQIKPPTIEKLNVENKARQGSKEQFDVVTETLADIYVKQGYYRKAIEIFNTLILNYPEKKAYFANRISELEGDTNKNT